MKKIKKYYPLIVGLVLLVSVAAYGTRAYFSDSTSQEAGIELQLGNIHVTGTSESWKYISTDKDINSDLRTEDDQEVTNDDLGKNIKLKHVRPGDSFEKTFIFKNEGSLTQVLSFENLTASTEFFNVAWSQNGTVELAPNKTSEVTMTVTVPNTIESVAFSEDGANSFSKSELNNFVGETVTVNAVQTNANVK